MALTNGKHIVKELEGFACTIIEEQASKLRVEFLESLLQFNRLDVVIVSNALAEGSEQTYTIGVRDITFNPIIAIYAKKMYTKQGHIVTPNIWNQISKNQHVPYWTVGTQSLELYSEEYKSSN